MNIEQSLAELRQRATKLKDFSDWMKTTPGALPGLTRSLHPDSYDIDILYRPSNAVNHTFISSALSVTVKIMMNIDFEAAPELNALSSTANRAVPTQQIAHNYYLDLPLKDWPIATALVVAAYFEFAYYESDEVEARVARQRLDQFLALHFPDFTMTKIYDLFAADLLPVDSKGQPERTSLVAMLFNSRNQQKDITLPIDAFHL